MKAKKSTVLPLVLLAYLGIMSYIGYAEYASGKSSALYYFGIIAITLVVILMLHFSLKRRERLAAERRADMEPHARGPESESLTVKGADVSRTEKKNDDEK